jgi:hypothetical protein
VRLRILCGLFALSPPVLFAQQPAPPNGTVNQALDQAIGRIQGKDWSRPRFPAGWRFPPAGWRSPIEKARQSGVCSVPLLAMSVPKDAGFTMKVVHPDPGIRPDRFDNVPAPAPPCGTPMPGKQ